MSYLWSLISLTTCALLIVSQMVLTFHVPIRTELFALRKGKRWVWTATFLIYQAFSNIRHWVSPASLNTRFMVSCFGFCNLLIFYMIGSLVLRKIPKTEKPLCWLLSSYSFSTSPAWYDLFRHSSRSPCETQALPTPSRYQHKGGNVIVLVVDIDVTLTLMSRFSFLY